MSLAIPYFAVRSAPLTKVLEEAYTHYGRRTKTSIRNIPLSSLFWGAIQEKTFLQLQDTLRKSVKLSYPKPDMELCVYTDASDKYRSAVVTPHKSELDLPTSEQQHETLAFLGGASNQPSVQLTFPYVTESVAAGTTAQCAALPAA